MDPHWFQCGSEYGSRSRVLMTKNWKKLQLKIFYLTSNTSKLEFSSLLLVILALLDPDPNSQCGSGSSQLKWMRIRIRIPIRIRIQNTGGGTGVKFAAGVNNFGGKFATVATMPVVTLPPVSWTPVINNDCNIKLPTPLQWHWVKKCELLPNSF